MRKIAAILGLLTATILVSAFVATAALAPQQTSSVGPAAINWGGSIKVFKVGSDKQLYVHNMASPDGAYIGLGGTVVGQPSATSAPNGNLYVFVTGTDGRIYERHTANFGTWSAWASIDP